MTAEEIKISHHLKFFGIRSHNKIDLLDLLKRRDVRVVVRDLEGLKHFSILNKNFQTYFFDRLLTDYEFARSGFASFVYSQLGGTPQTAYADNQAQRDLAALVERIVRRIIAPITARLNFNQPRRRSHHIAVPKIVLSPPSF